MKTLTKKIILSLVTVVIISCGKSNSQDAALYAEVAKNSAPNTLTDDEKKNGWQLLFDGKTFNGWHGYNIKEIPNCWTIEDGTLTPNTKGGSYENDIVTNKKYRNFAFSADIKLTTAANSGIVFQVAEDPKYKYPYQTGPEFQVIDNEGWDITYFKLKENQINGANYEMYPPMVKPYKPIGEWNHYFLVVKGNMVTQILNGEVTVKYEKYSDDWTKRRDSGKWTRFGKFPDWGNFDEGYISPQNHGTKVWYRNIKIKEL